MKLTLLMSVVLLGLSPLTEAAPIAPVSVVTPDMLKGARQPQAAVDSQGTIYVTYGAGESIYCSVSSDGGKSYRDPVKIAAVPRLALGKRRGPRVAVGQDSVVVTAIGHQDGNVLAWRSTDEGRHWHGPVTINDSPRDAREGLHAMAAGPQGELVCVWLDCRDQKRGSRIFAAGSTDGGKTWTENREVYHSPSGSVCECCHPSVVYDHQGALHVMWRNSLDGNRDLYLASSRDGGQTFAAAVKLGSGAWPLEGCPMDGGCLAATAPNRLTTVWRRQTQILRTDGMHEEQLIGSGEQPWATANQDGAWLVWISRRGGDLFLTTPVEKTPIKIASHAFDPVISAPAAGRGPAVAVWETDSASSSGILAAVVGH